MQFKNLRQFLITNFNLKPEGTIDLRQFEMLIKMSARWFGVIITQWLADFFMPQGDDNISHYLFVPISWCEFERNFGELDPFIRQAR
jgi:hypothetical protein